MIRIVSALFVVLCGGFGASGCMAHGVHPDNRVTERPNHVWPATRHGDLLVKADFDGNGVEDSAFYVLRYDEYMLVAYMNDGAHVAELLSYGASIAKYGIKLAEPGSYRNPCAPGGHDHGRSRCAGVSGEVQLQNPAISAFMYESHGILLYWRDGRFHVFNDP